MSNQPADALKRARECLRDFAENWDCDSDAHRYSTGCRKCLAEKEVASIDAVLPAAVEVHPSNLTNVIDVLETDLREANAELVLHKEDRLRLRKENMLLKRLLVTARDVVATNRLVLGEHMGPEYISRLTAEIDAAVPHRPRLELDMPDNWNAYNTSEGD